MAAWLFVVAAFVYMMVVIGGATRLTGSGLSITEWKPVTGAIPPLTDSAWLAAFQKYRATSQFRLINQGISLDEFKVLYGWEWGHRLLARWVGLVFAAPFVFFLVSRRLPPRLTGRCIGLLALGGLQGLVGWWMVKSGLEGRASVAPERLAVHLALALMLLAALIWTALEAWTGEARVPGRARDAWAPATALFAAGIFLQCLMGALVAGNGGGLVDNDWPLMGGHVVPTDYWRGNLWSTVAHGPAAAQFDHRLFAYGLLTFGIVLAAAGARSAGHCWRGRVAILAVALLAIQAGLGVATLVFGDPLGLALLHQANAALLLSVAVGLAWLSRRPPGIIIP